MACLRPEEAMFKNQTMVDSSAEESGPGGKLHPHLTYTPKSPTFTCFYECLFGWTCSASWPLRVTTQPHGLYNNQTSLLQRKAAAIHVSPLIHGNHSAKSPSFNSSHARSLSRTYSRELWEISDDKWFYKISKPSSDSVVVAGVCITPTPKYFFVESNRGNLSDGRRLDWCVCRKSVNNINFIWTYEYEQAVAILTWAFLFFFKVILETFEVKMWY